MNERTKELMQQCGWINFDANAVHRTFIECAMMLEFDTLCNDENYED